MWHVLDDREAITFLRGSGNPKHHEEADELEAYICKPWRYERIDEGQTRLYLFIGLLTGLLNGLVTGLLNGLNVDDECQRQRAVARKLCLPLRHPCPLRCRCTKAPPPPSTPPSRRRWRTKASPPPHSSFTEHKNIYGRTKLHHSAAGGPLECVQLLCEKWGASLTAKDNNSHTPIHLAAANGHLEVLKWLYPLTREWEIWL